MKRILLTFLALLAPIAVYAQGQVVFANTSTTLITTNNGVNSGPMSGAGNYRIGLYVGPAGSDEWALTLAGTALNSPLAGRFSGGNPFAIPGAPAGTEIAFQIRGWTAAAGATYEQTISSGGHVGRSALGSVTPTAAPNPAAALFGTGPGQVGGFIIGIPEPSSVAITAMGLGALLFFRPRQRA